MAITHEDILTFGIGELNEKHYEILYGFKIGSYRIILLKKNLPKEFDFDDLYKEDNFKILAKIYNKHNKKLDL